MSIKYAFGMLFLSFALPSSTYAAPVTWPDNGHEYQVIAVSDISWTNARTAAQALGPGWDLATIGSAAENTFVESLLASGLTDRAHFWLGATDVLTEDTWVWVDGTPWSFTDWWAGEPGDTNNEDHLAYDLRSGSWAWNDVPDDLQIAFPGYSQGYVAERSISDVPGPGDSTSIPTLSEWGLLILTLLLGFYGVFRVRRIS